MQNFGRNLFILGLVIAFGLAVGTTFFIGTICQLDPENPPQTILSYPALCFTVWAFGPPIGMILAATGADARAEEFRRYGSARNLYHFNIDHADQY